MSWLGGFPVVGTLRFLENPVVAISLEVEYLVIPRATVLSFFWRHIYNHIHIYIYMIILFEYYNYKHNLYHIYIYIWRWYSWIPHRRTNQDQTNSSGSDLWCCAAVVEAGSRELQPENQMSQMSQTGQKLFYKSIWMPQLGLQVRRTRQISSNLSDSKFAKQNVLLHVLFSAWRSQVSWELLLRADAWTFEVQLPFPFLVWHCLHLDILWNVLALE